MTPQLEPKRISWGPPQKARRKTPQPCGLAILPRSETWACGKWSRHLQCRRAIPDGRWILAVRYPANMGRAKNSPSCRNANRVQWRHLVLRSEERRVGKSVDLGGRRIIKKKTREYVVHY